MFFVDLPGSAFLFSPFCLASLAGVSGWFGLGFLVSPDFCSSEGLRSGLVASLLELLTGALFASVSPSVKP